jgi:hypothetical protein
MSGSKPRRAFAALLIPCVMPGYLVAADTAAAPTPTLSDILGASGITANGYISATYYGSSGYNTFHEFDTQHDTFQLDQAGLLVAYQPHQGFGALVDLMAGEDARVLNGEQSGGSSQFAVQGVCKF